MIQPKEEFMKAAIEEALKAKAEGDYCVGAVIVKDDKVIVRVGNRVKLDENSISHAEVVAIQEATKILGTRHLEGCILYATHEPCPMCSSAAVWARMKGIVCGTKIEDMANYRAKNTNNDWSWRTINIPASIILEKGEPKLFLVEGFLREECKELFHS